MTEKAKTKTEGKPVILNLMQKIFLVQQAVEIAKKEGRNEHHQYWYAKEINILDAVKPLLGKYSLLVTQTTVSHEIVDGLNKIGIDFTITNAANPEEKITERFYGTGADKAGTTVGTPIAYTMAVKYFLAKTFLLETGDDAEIEKRKKAGGNNETPEQKFTKAKGMIEKMNKVEGLLEYDKIAKQSESFTPAMKAEIHKLISTKVDAISNPKTANKN